MEDSEAREVGETGGTGVSRSVDQLSQARIAVLGDVMVDRFIWGSVARISPEAPVPVVDVDLTRQEEGHRLGGAANVAANVVALGGRAMIFGVIGDDAAGQQFWRLLASCGIDGRGAVSAPGRPTTLKTRVVAHSQQVVRFDVEDRSPLPSELLEQLYARVLEAADSFDGVIISDYAKGVLDPTRLPALIEALRSLGKLVAVDPKVGRMDAYRGATVATPNRSEACAAAGTAPGSPDAARVAGRWWLERLQTESILVTLGEEGMLLLRRDGTEYHMPAQAAEVFDVTGAGDTVIATLGMARVVGLRWQEAVRLANGAAGVVVGKIGTATASPLELKEFLCRAC